MNPQTIRIQGGRCVPEDGPPADLVISADEVRAWLRTGAFWHHLFRYREARLTTPYLPVMPRPFLACLLPRLLSRGKAYVEDEQGAEERITMGRLGRRLARLLLDALGKRGLLRRLEEDLEILGKGRAGLKRPSLDPSGRPLYLRTDLWFGVQAGGSVGHIAGVLNQLDRFGAPPLFVTTEPVATVRADIETEVVPPPRRFWDLPELASMCFSELFFRRCREMVEDQRISFVYQRYGVNNYSGIKLSQLLGVPFVLEYNGSEVWISKHWGVPLTYQELSTRIELLNLLAADLVVVVSRPIEHELLSRGVHPDRILVNPNGVDPDRYSPKVNGTDVRKRHGLEGKVLIGFIGTFGRWHGAEVLAEAFGILLEESPALRDRVRLLMIGDGLTMPLVREALARRGAADACVFTGLVPQREGPRHLAACDILVSPHVPNPDGTPFFGSPTKLFEYMAMGKPIVASDLDQIGEVLKHGQSACLVRPGDPVDLARGLRAVLDDPELRRRLGEEARRNVLARHTWRRHTQRIVDALSERCPPV